MLFYGHRQFVSIATLMTSNANIIKRFVNTIWIALWMAVLMATWFNRFEAIRKCRCGRAQSVRVLSEFIRQSPAPVHIPYFQPNWLKRLRLKSNGHFYQFNVMSEIAAMVIYPIKSPAISSINEASSIARPSMSWTRQSMRIEKRFHQMAYEYSML